jgi:outer membrane protein assembly factor BamA
LAPKIIHELRLARRAQQPFEASQRSANKWVPYSEAQPLAAFSRLLRTHFLDDLWIEVIDEPYENRVPAKHVIFHLEAQRRVKSIDDTGSTDVKVSEIEDAVRTKNILRPGGGFVDEYSSMVRQVRRVIQDLYAERGYPSATVEVTKTPLAASPGLFHLTFEVHAGPKRTASTTITT